MASGIFICLEVFSKFKWNFIRNGTIHSTSLMESVNRDRRGGDRKKGPFKLDQVKSPPNGSALRSYEIPRLRARTKEKENRGWNNRERERDWESRHHSSLIFVRMSPNLQSERATEWSQSAHFPSHLNFHLFSSPRRFFTHDSCTLVWVRSPYRPRRSANKRA